METVRHGILFQCKPALWVHGDMTIKSVSGRVKIQNTWANFLTKIQVDSTLDYNWRRKKKVGHLCYTPEINRSSVSVLFLKTLKGVSEIKTRWSCATFTNVEVTQLIPFFIRVKSRLRSLLLLLFARSETKHNEPDPIIAALMYAQHIL